MKSHKHAKEIHAWADGAIIQTFNPQTEKWEDVANNRPLWYEYSKYRVKPKILKYRVVLMGESNKFYPFVVTNPEFESDLFVKYLTDWVEVEI